MKRLDVVIATPLSGLGLVEGAEGYVVEFVSDHKHGIKAVFIAADTGFVYYLDPNHFRVTWISA